MAASATQNPAVKTESKSAKKKKAKAASAESEASAPAVTEATPSAADSTAGDGGYESPYIKELYKNIRNVNKKITNASKVDSIVASNPGKSLDELVSAKLINADQKAQILKKPALQASLTQLEEQIAQYKKFDQDYKSATQAEKAEFEKSLTERANKELADAVAAAKLEAGLAAQKEQQDNLLLLSQFLKLAAIRRSEEEAAELEESKALEGLLGQVYTGDATAVAAMMNLIQGTSEKVVAVTGDVLSIDFAHLKTISSAVPPTISAEPEFRDVDDEETVPGTPPAVETSEYPVQSDPTIANAGLTEIDAPQAASLTNGHGEPVFETQGIPQNSGFGDGAANAAAEANWDHSNDLSTSQEWVEVPRDATETDTGITATPAAPSQVQSWADDQPESPTQPISTPPNPNDGFQEIQRNRGGRGQNQYRGGRGGPRGDGSFNRGRGGFRGRGGEGFRGGRGGPRGNRGRGSDES
ncbi:uncharacterized protein PAC_03927 [Phialocephala subalpina]|uniref:YAG7-like dimerisation domain-containing protein n=1 Tax=Phialocephala subalpina TaxID=576137 RepID=A0A1L7WMP8_9HELO|nr:uncharacterized protein PAC_03927 [Phialocephala subalpina]